MGSTVVNITTANGKHEECNVSVKYPAILSLPTETMIIESEAFTGLNVYAIRIAETVLTIAPDAFDKSTVLYLEKDSKWIEWAEENGFAYVIE